ncbi:hypothetical protein BO94DRAFT_511950 [Aspergillus sclerotioniger CBS 115572]|uniref:Zn(2)-C6 fungal-type domain-containing protein n=1 Tax=Aspergillus sclerotioniger CBS 115572 TaxID=1450535 RepID=A0A317X651_9EURO|nr:hypothetical protein BO94DRAFT_511950 [Aspergillus sclerotioniger CBS 115572]PWY93037.1 hypothetical protein BO94DRAFT_511950 [Aspergillus sclerotioniger CBS 115572]
MNATTSAVKRRACVACTNAKAKCTPHGVNLCQRCARLGKSCTYLDLPQTKRKHKQKTDSSRVEVLEKKVDQLMSQLAALAQQNGQTSPDTSYPPTTTNSGLSRTPEPEPTDIAAMLDAAKDPSHGINPPTSSGLEGHPSIVDRGLLSEAEAERLLTTFQLHFLPKFPFVLLAHGETAARLKDREPFLFLCIVAATMESSHPLRRTVSEEIMKHVTLRVVERSERNLELLRGLLVYSAWYSYPAERCHPRLLLLIQFCVSIMYDLGLHRKTGLGSDEQRALLGAYWLSVGLNGTLGRPNVMKHDGRINECVASLASTQYLSDRWIAPFIYLQLFLATIDEAYASIQASGGRVLVQVTRGSLQREFDGVKARVEKDLTNCPLSIDINQPIANALWTEIKYAEIRLEELSLREDLWITEPSSPVRTTMLMGIIQRSKELIHMVRSLPASEIAQITIMTSARICAAVGYMPTATLALLNLVPNLTDSIIESQIPAIDTTEYPRLVIDLATALETRVEGMSAADKEMDIVGSLCSKMRLLARCYPYQIRATMPSHDARQDTTMMAVDANEVTMAPSMYGDLGDMFPVDDIQWDALLSNFTVFN